MLRIAENLIGLVADTLRWLRLSVRSSRSIKAENLFLRRQLALYIERGVKSRRIDWVTRIGLTLRVVTRVPQNHVEIKGYNGASGEGGAQGLLFELSPFNQAPESLDYALSRIDDIGGPKTYNLYPVAWGWAMNTPFQWFKMCW